MATGLHPSLANVTNVTVTLPMGDVAVTPLVTSEKKNSTWEGVKLALRAALAILLSSMAVQLADNLVNFPDSYALKFQLFEAKFLFNLPIQGAVQFVIIPLVLLGADKAKHIHDKQQEVTLVAKADTVKVVSKPRGLFPF